MEYLLRSDNMNIPLKCISILILIILVWILIFKFIRDKSSALDIRLPSADLTEVLVKEIKIGSEKEIKLTKEESAAITKKFVSILNTSKFRAKRGLRASLIFLYEIHCTSGDAVWLFCIGEPEPSIKKTIIDYEFKSKQEYASGTISIDYESSLKIVKLLQEYINSHEKED